MATNRDDTSYIHTAYFCFDDHMHMYFVSQLSSVHVQNIEKNPSTAASVFDTRQPWDEWKLGLQFFGESRATNKDEFKHASELYKLRFPDYKKWLHSLGKAVASTVVPPFYVFVPTRVKILDENEFGEETYVEATIHRT